jgi:hypothetical protein
MSATEDSLESLWAYCGSLNRVCPMPQRWNALFAKLANTSQNPSGGWAPPLPLILAAWYDTSAAQKQLRFMEHLDWASEQGRLEEIGSFLRALPEGDWLHFEEM